MSSCPAAAGNFLRVSLILITESAKPISYAIRLISQREVRILDKLVRYHILAGFPDGLVLAACQGPASLWNRYLTVRFLRSSGERQLEGNRQERSDAQVYWVVVGLFACA